jgi:hypothetical protein
MKPLGQTQKKIALIGAIILVAMWLYPPWIHGTGAYRHTAGYYFLFDTNQHNESVHSIDFGRLFAQTVVVCIIIAILTLLFRAKSPK